MRSTLDLTSTFNSPRTVEHRGNIEPPTLSTYLLYLGLVRDVDVERLIQSIPTSKRIGIVPSHCRHVRPRPRAQRRSPLGHGTYVTSTPWEFGAIPQISMARTPIVQSFNRSFVRGGAMLGQFLHHALLAWFQA